MRAVYASGAQRNAAASATGWGGLWKPSGIGHTVKGNCVACEHKRSPCVNNAWNADGGHAASTNNKQRIDYRRVNE
ncbi:MAG: hypothetical protein JST70_13670 [Bacteroidetes bacterium]|nr:hypothetical protein [Bacteroidota bacterium]